MEVATEIILNPNNRENLRKMFPVTESLHPSEIAFEDNQIDDGVKSPPRVHTRLNKR